MGVEKDQLFAVMRAIISKRDGQGFETDTRALRLILEFGNMPAARIVEQQHLFYENKWLSQSAQDRPSCWINTKGLCFWIDYGYHSTFAGMIAGGCTSLLEAAGWIHVSDGRMDVLYEPTPQQARRMAELEASNPRFKQARSIRNRPPKRPSCMHPGLDSGPLSSYQWDDPRYWENRGIERTCHGRGVIGPNPQAHVGNWQEAMRVASYSDKYRFNPAYVPHAKQFDQYVSGRAEELYERSLRRDALPPVPSFDQLMLYPLKFYDERSMTT